jgi:hypothetical protein
MPECTENERKLLDLVLTGRSFGEAVNAVHAERMTEAAKERVVLAIIAARKARREEGAAMDAIGVRSTDRLARDLAAEADRRMLAERAPAEPEAPVGDG